MEKPKDLFELYSNQILTLAADIPLLERLNSPDVTITNRTPLCGSLVTIDLKMSNNTIVDYAHDVKACALGQASTSILAQGIVGKTSDQIIDVRNAVFKMLNGSIYTLEIFPQYQVLSPAKEFKNRHASIMLPLDATVKAIKKIKLDIKSRLIGASKSY